MAQITKAEEMVGRTIEGAYAESLIVVLNLGNGDYICISPEGDYEGGADLELCQTPSSYEKHKAGLLSEEEYAKAEAEHVRITAERMKAAELAQLKKLQQKYPKKADNGNESRA